MINDETLANVERLASQALDLFIIQRYLDLSPSDANDPQVTEAYELGRARGAAVVMGQLTVASGRGNISATKTLLSRLDETDSDGSR